MSNVFDHMLQQQQFTPTNTTEYVALQLAKRLNDEAAVNRYIQFFAHHSLEQLLRLFHQVKKAPSPAREFHSLLTSPDS